MRHIYLITVFADIEPGKEYFIVDRLDGFYFKRIAGQSPAPLLNMMQLSLSAALANGAENKWRTVRDIDTEHERFNVSTVEELDAKMATIAQYELDAAIKRRDRNIAEFGSAE